MIPRGVRENACQGLSLAFAEGVDIHPDVKPIAHKLCGGLPLDDDDRVRISLFHTQFGDAEPDGRRDELRYLQMGGFEAIAWAFPPAKDPEPVEKVDPNGVLGQLEAALGAKIDLSAAEMQEIDDLTQLNAAEVTQPRLDKLSVRLSSIDDRLRAKIEGILAVTLRVAASKVGVQLARAGTKRKGLPPEAKQLHDELGNSLEFLQAAKPETSGLIKTWALAQLSVTEEQLAIAELEKLPDEILPAFVDASGEVIDALAEELDIDRASVAEQLEPRHEEGRRSVLDYLAAISPALVLGRLNAGSNEGVPVKATVPKGIVDDVLRVGGGADYNSAGAVPFSDSGSRLRDGIEMDGDLFAKSDDVLDTIESIEGTRPETQKFFSHIERREQLTQRDKDTNVLHRNNHGRPQGEATATPQRNRGCDCEWETVLQAAGIQLAETLDPAVIASAHVCELHFAEIKKTFVSSKEKDGYEIRVELWDNGVTQPHEMTTAYNLDGDWIGTVERAKELVEKRGIAPQLRTGTSNVCSIGYSEKEDKWYGWSHRAIFGFAVGHKIKKGSVIRDLGVGKVAKTLADAKRFAEAFAEGVS